MPLIMRHVMHSIMLSKHHYLRVVNESEKARVDQASEEDHQSVEDGFDFCGSSVDFDFPFNIGKPRSIQPYPCCLQLLLLIAFYEMCSK